jgi:hypothetical protein
MPKDDDSVFKPKDEEPYGRLNPKASVPCLHAAPWPYLLLLRRRNGCIDNSDGSYHLEEPA